MKPTLLILAAGMGSRYGGIKQIEPIGPNGEIIVDYSIFDAINAGFKKLVFVIREDLEMSFREKFNHLESQIDIGYVFQESDLEGFTVNSERKKPWGTGHAILCAASEINDPFVVINADDFYGPDAFEKGIKYLASNTDQNQYCMVGYRLKNTLSPNGTVSRGIGTTDSEGFLLSIKEHHDIQQIDGEISFVDAAGRHPLSSDNVSMNFWGFYPGIFQHINDQFKDFIEINLNNPGAEFYIPSVVDTLIASEVARVKVLKTDARWYGVTYQEDKPLVVEGVNNLINENVYPASLWKKN